MGAPARVHESQIQFRTRDINWAGHLDNVEAVRIFDEARTLFLGYPIAGRPGMHEGVLALIDRPSVVHLVVGQSVEYTAEVPFSPAPLLVRQWVGAVGGSSFTLQAQLLTGSTVVAAMESTVVLRDLEAGAGWALNDALRAELESYLGDPVPLRIRG